MKEVKSKVTTTAIQLIAEPKATSQDHQRFSVVVLTIDGDKVVGRDVESNLNYFSAVNLLKRKSAALWAPLIHITS